MRYILRAGDDRHEGDILTSSDDLDKMVAEAKRVLVVKGLYEEVLDGDLPDWSEVYDTDNLTTVST